MVLGSGGRTIQRAQRWILLLPNDNPLYADQLGSLARELRRLGHDAQVSSQPPAYLDSQDNLLSINLQGALGIKGPGSRISWIQDPAPGLSLSRVPELLDTKLFFLGGAVADDCGYPEGDILLPGINQRETAQLRNTRRSRADYAIIVGNYFEILTPAGEPIPALLDLVHRCYQPLSGALRVDLLLIHLMDEIASDKKTWAEFCQFRRGPRRHFGAQELGLRALVASLPGEFTKREISALISLSINVPRVLDRRQLSTAVLQAGFPAQFFGTGWDLLDLNPLMIRGPVSSFPASCPHLAEARFGIHSNTHGLMAHPTPLGFAELGIPIISHPSPLELRPGGAAHFALPGTHLSPLADLSRIWDSPPVVEDLARIDFVAANSWRSRASQLTAASDEMKFEASTST